MTITKRQHHVWRNYLRSWSRDDTIWCAMDGRIFGSNLMGVAQERYFYQVGEMTEKDIFLLSTMIDLNQSPEVRDSAKAWIAEVQRIFSYRDTLISMGVEKNELDEMTDFVSKQIGEKYQGVVENIGLKYMPMLLNSSVFEINKDDEYIDFIFFMMTQYFRTSRIKENLKRNLENRFPGYVDRSFGAIIPVMSTLTASAIVNRRQSLAPCVVENKSGVNFIAGDQPVINTYAADVFFDETVVDTEFFYPISPTKAIFLSKSDVYRCGEISDAHVVEELNRKIVVSAERQIFAATEGELDQWKALVGSHR